MKYDIYNILNSDGGIEIPIDDGAYTTELMFDGYSSGWMVIIFYDSDGEPVTPTAGTITPLAIVVEGQLQEPASGDTSITATTVIASTDGTATYDIPCFTGPMRYGQITFADIAGADHAKAYFWRG